jgi:chemosensory pili system protein ChpA (sensor histidine kinase/response regulator)
VNTVGLSPTGKVLHTVEDFLEELTKAPIMPPMRTVAGILVDVTKQVRLNLGTARSGWVETSLGSFAARTASAMHPGTSARTDVDMPDRGAGPATGGLKSIFDSAALFASANIRSDVGSANGSRPSKSDSNGSGNEGVSADERAYIRVATTRLDALMNLAGELVVSRSRMASRVGTLRFLYTELGRSRVRLTDTVESFRDQYEFANIGGKVSRASGRNAPVITVEASGAGGAATATTEMARVGRGGRELFGELELDEYGDIHVLSRSLAEIGNDFEEAFRTLSSELSSFAEDADSLGGIISGIQGEVTRARMVPLDAVFTRLRFPIRDAATRDVKEVQVVTEGADVNIDKTIADAILQPMLHLVRNAVAHGIESPSRRASLGKPRAGTIRLIARQQAGQIVIEVADDGAGLDLGALRARGIAQGLITPDTTADDPRVRELVFAPGLSTREVASDVAGRGVGGEVVKRTIERLNGAIRIDSVRGKGTSFVITLPLTLAITRALLVNEGKATYAVPLYFAERILDAETLSLAQTGDERRVLLDGQFTRVRRLDEYFGGSSASAKRGGPALVLRVGDERMVLQLDAVLGQEEIVVKRAGELLEGHPLFAGVTLRGTGDLVMIVDVPGLLSEFARARSTDDVAGPVQGVSVIEAKPLPAPAQKPRRPSTKLKAAPKLPAKADKAEGVQVVPAPQAARATAPQPLSGVRALVVDDSLSVRKVAEAHLRGLGVDVVVAVDGVDGLAKLREGRFDVVFTDLEMPRMHGYDFVRQLRMLAAYQSLPVVVVSSRSGQKHQDHARSVGATDYITKPFSAQSLESTIRRWLRS